MEVLIILIYIKVAITEGKKKNINRWFQTF